MEEIALLYLLHTHKQRGKGGRQRRRGGEGKEARALRYKGNGGERGSEIILFRRVGEE